MKATFDRDGVGLDLTVSEYGFIYLSLSYVLHGAHFEDHDFRNILGMERDEAEMLMTWLREAEQRARARGQHWIQQTNPADPSS